MKRQFRTAFLFAILILSMFGWISISLIFPPHNHPTDPEYGYPMLGIVFIGSLLVVWYWNHNRRQAALLTHGDVCFARVILSEVGESTWSALVAYQKELPGGHLLEGVVTDHTQSFHVGMLVPVFYNAADPSKNIALCGSIYDIRAARQG